MLILMPLFLRINIKLFLQNSMFFCYQELPNISNSARDVRDEKFSTIDLSASKGPFILLSRATRRDMPLFIDVHGMRFIWDYLILEILIGERSSHVASSQGGRIDLKNRENTSHVGFLCVMPDFQNNIVTKMRKRDSYDWIFCQK